MNDEIKEIKEELAKISFSNIGHCVNTNLILDYITNLEKENKKLLKKSYNDDVIITKAIKMVKQNLMGIGYVEASKLLNILQGEDNNE